MVQGIGAIVLRVSKATLTFHMAAKVTIPISIYNVTYIDYSIPLSFFNGLLTFFILIFKVHLYIFLQILMSASEIPTFATKIQHASI